MLYLAEVKTQNRNFVSGYKTELKLLASQAGDQTWNIISGEEIVSTDAINEQTTKGTLYIVNLGNNKQVQSAPELAGARMVNYLRHLSRTLEKSKSQEEEIDKWKKSLKRQGEEIARRQLELDQQQQILQQQQLELAQLEQDKEKLSGAWEQIRQEESRAGEYKNKLKNFIQELNNSGFNAQNIRQTLSSVDEQKKLWDNYSQTIEAEKSQLQQKQQQLSQQKQELDQKQQQLISLQAELQQTTVQLESYNSSLKYKQGILKQLEDNSGAILRLNQEVSFIIDDSDEMDIDFKTLESMPLGNLEQTVSKLQQETAKLVNFVNLQEEELSSKTEEVRDIQHKILEATDMEKFSLETELADAKEGMKLLNETLVGQRKTLKKQQKILNEHSKILTRRKGINDVDFSQNINLRPLLREIQTLQSSLNQQKDNLTTEIAELEKAKAQINNAVAEKTQKYNQQQEEWQQQQQQWLELYQEVARLQIETKILDEKITPFQQGLNNMRERLQRLESSSQKIDQIIQEVQSLVNN